MKRYLFLFMILCSLQLIAYGRRDIPSVMTEPGISLELAKHRVATIHDLRYNITFGIPSDRAQPIEGKEDIRFSLKDRQDIIIDFREEPQHIHEVRMNGKHCQYDIANEHIIIPQQYTRKGENMVSIDFTAGNQSLNRRDDYLYTLFVPDRARTAFPCFDQPNLKGRFKLTLDLPDGWTAVSNSKGQGGHRITFDETEPLSTYLFAFAAGKFQYETYTEDGRTIGAYHRETDTMRVRQLPDIMRQVVFALKWQENFTGMEYPFSKYDLVILPGFQFGGMEHTGATFYNDNTIFLPANPTIDERLRQTELIAHETSHMWFGDAVTMDWFNDVWTKEVFANYFAAEITAPLYPEVDHELNWQKTYVNAAISQDRTEGRTSIRQELDNMRHAGLIYNNIIYNKAPVMMRKMVSLMGKEAFRRGIQEYVARFKYGNATWDDLIDILDKETPADLRSFSKEWVDTANFPRRKATDCRDGLDAGYYGFTEMEEEMQLDMFNNAKTPLEQQLALMCLNENFMSGNLSAAKYVKPLVMIASTHDDPLICSTAINNLHEPMLVLPPCQAMETQLWDIANNGTFPAWKRTQLMRLLMSRGKTEQTTRQLYELWQQGSSSLLSENDFMTLAYELAIRMPEQADSIIAAQHQRLSNPDRRAQFAFIAPATSANNAVRDSVFSSLMQAENRRIEPWALSALYYLNHPLRSQESIRYIQPALELLTEIQRTGDIFFPQNWCSRLLAGHRSKEANNELQQFLAKHPDMMPLLRNKIMTAAFGLQRSIIKKDY